MDLTRARESIARKRQNKSAAKETSLPPPPPLQEGVVPATVTPRVSSSSIASVPATPHSSRPGGSGLFKDTSEQPEGSTLKRPGGSLSGEPADKRPTLGMTAREMLPDVGLRTVDPPASRTRSKAYAAPPSALRSHDLGVQLNYLQGMANSSDRFCMEGMSARDKVKAAAQFLPKAAIMCAEVIMDAYNGTIVDDLKKKLQRAQEQLEKTEAQLEEKDKAWRGLGDEVSNLIIQKDSLEVQLDKANMQYATRLDRALKRAHQEWVQNLANSAEGQNLIAQFKDDFLKSKEFSQLTNDKNTEFFDRGFAEAVDQFQKAGYPPAGVAADFLDAEEGLLNMFRKEEEPEKSYTSAQPDPQSAMVPVLPDPVHAQPSQPTPPSSTAEEEKAPDSTGEQV